MNTLTITGESHATGTVLQHYFTSEAFYAYQVPLPLEQKLHIRTDVEDPLSFLASACLSAKASVMELAGSFGMTLDEDRITNSKLRVEIGREPTGRS